MNIEEFGIKNKLEIVIYIKIKNLVVALMEKYYIQI